MSAVVIVFALVGCKATVEGEAKRWDAKVAQMQGYAAARPNFKAAIDAHMAAATASYDAAKAKGQGEAAAEGMAAANAEVDELLGLFDRVEDRTREIGRLERDHDLLSLSARVVTPAIKAADEAVEVAEEILREAAPADAAAAKVSLSAALDRLDRGARELRRLRDRAKRDRRKLEKALKVEGRGANEPVTRTETVKGLH
ncbi:MAG: hypothetical protein R3A79_26250 [Nannocystaceae bacterium]